MLAFVRSLAGALTVACGISLVLSFIPGWAMLAYVSVLFGSYNAFKAAYASVKAREVDVNLLMVLAAAGAIGVGRPEDAGMLLFLFSLSGALEEMAMARTKNAIEALVQLRPDKALRVGPKGEETVPVESLVLGDRVRVSPFEAIPVDGLVLEGTSSIDASAMTGESREVDIQNGSEVVGGTRNLSGSFLMEVRSTVGDSTLDKIVELVRDAQENKASGERISAWFGQRYTFFVLFAFAISFGIRIAIGYPRQDAFYSSLTLLVALSPCALVISIPATTLSALAFAARNGILVRGGEFIERAGQINTVALDKTGTLTTGRPRLVEICVCKPVMAIAGSVGGSCTDEGACWRGEGEPSEDARFFLEAAASVEAHSTHPVALAVREAADRIGMVVPTVENERAVPGLGIAGDVNGRKVRIGQLRFLESEGVPTSPEFIEHVSHLQHEGLTVALLAVDDRLAAIGFADTPRPEAKDFLAKMRSEGVDQFVMLTGDTKETAEAIAKELDLTEIKAGLLPHQKTEYIRDLVASGRKVMMVGDGVNDAPALAISTLGVAMGGLGSDVAMKAADVVLMHDRLDRLPLLLHLGKRANGVIRANLFFSSGVILILTGFSLAGHLPLPFAVAGHEGSTVLVILNGLRLLK